MKSLIQLLLIICFTVFIGGCEKDTTRELHGKLKSHSECKSELEHDPMTDTPGNLSCVEYTYEAHSKKLILKHYNSAFNCCPGTLSCEITLQKQVINITEKESARGCRCNCLYDLEIEIEDVSARKYILKFYEPYVKTDDLLEFVIDLGSKPSGSACVSRTEYPWRN
jgi:hypothetical protein